jgi:hypothetical protein
MTLYVTDNEVTRQQLLSMIDSTTEYAVDIKPVSTYTKSQRGALHVWCAQCAHTLNEKGLYRERPNILGCGTQTIPWTMETFKEDVYKFVLNSITGKNSTEEQSSIEPSDVVEVIRTAYQSKLNVDLPVWPCNR